MPKSILKMGGSEKLSIDLSKIDFPEYAHSAIDWMW